MVFNPISPIQAFGRRPVIIARSPTPHGAAASMDQEADPPTNDSRRSSSLFSLPNWRGGLTNGNHQSQERHNPPEEISRWSKTTTDSEGTDLLAFPVPPTKKTNMLTKRLKQRKKSKDTTNSSPVDPLYDPITKAFILAENPEPAPVTSPAIGPITGPDPPRSFYDSGSDDSSDAEPVLQRASSVRVGRPHIVQHSNHSGGSVPKLCAPQTTPTSDGSLVPKPLTLGHQLKSIYNVVDGDDAKDDEAVNHGPQAALKALEGFEPGLESVVSPTEMPPNASTGPRDTLKKTVLEYPDTPTRGKATDTLPTAMGGFGSLRLHKTESDAGYSTTTFVAPSIDGLRSNPPSESDKKLSRAISAPARHPARRVTIRPTDLVIHKAANDHKQFRESIVSTPYPDRKNSLGEFIGEKGSFEVFTPSRRLRRSRPLSNHKEANSEDEKAGGRSDHHADEKTTAPKVPLSTKPIMSGLGTGKSDRFPSPVAPESLFLDLRLARHPFARVTVEVEVADKTTFDDEQLFLTIRKAYNTKLLGLARGLLSARRLSHVSTWTSSTNSDFDGHNLRRKNATWHGQQPAHDSIDGADFVQHIWNPQLGRRRKNWLLWLRNQQYHGPSTRPARSRLAQHQHQHQPSPQDDSESPLAFSFMRSRNNSATGNTVVFSTASNSSSATTTADASPTQIPIPPSTAGLSRAVSTAGVPRPSITIPRMPFQTHTHATRDAIRAAPATAAALSSPPQHSHPTLYLHYTFSLRKIAAMLALTVVSAIFTAAMWIAFGVPGRGADDGDGVDVGDYGGDVVAFWRRDAHKRVGVGLLLGVVVLLLGLVAEVAWVWGSWVLI